MIPLSLVFPCPSCAARIKAPLALVGQERDCPGCGHTFTVPYPIRSDIGPILVPLDEGYAGYGSARRRVA